MTTTPAEAPVDVPAGNDTPIHGVLAVEGSPTGDCREFEPNSVVWEQLPQPVEWGYTGQHDPTKHVGWIDTITRVGNEIQWTGRAFDQEFIDYLNSAGKVGGSVVCDDEEYMVFAPDGYEEPVDGEPMKSMCQMMVFQHARIRAFTVLTVGAIIEAWVGIGNAAIPAPVPDAITAADGTFLSISEELFNEAEAAGQVIEAGVRADDGVVEYDRLPQATHAGILLTALDTGRVLMLQRALADGDDNGGLWEFPGGGIDEGEDPETAARREFAEEVGVAIPAEAIPFGNTMNGTYILHGFSIPEEAMVDIDSREHINPDDPDGDFTEALAWWDIDHIQGDHIRPEVLSTPLPLMNEESAMTELATAPPAAEPNMPPPADKAPADKAPADAKPALTADDKKYLAGLLDEHQSMLDEANAFIKANPDSVILTDVQSHADDLTGDIDEINTLLGKGASPTASDALVASVAAANLVAPPDEWFEAFDLDGPTPVTVTADGRVFGHIASWNSCHRSAEFAGQCVRPPSDPEAPFFYSGGQVLTASGNMLDVGRLTVGGGHADRRMGLVAALEHYDDASATAAIVRLREDKYGIGVFGSIVADATPEQVAALRRSPISADWRKERGKWRLVAAHGVNVGGYPIPRGLVASVGRSAFIVNGRVEREFEDEGGVEAIEIRNRFSKVMNAEADALVASYRARMEA